MMFGVVALGLVVVFVGVEWVLRRVSPRYAKIERDMNRFDKP